MEGIVDVVVSSLLNSVTQILVRQTNLILNAREQFESFQIELRFIHEFLRNAAGKQDKVKEVVKQIQDVALEAGDLIDDFVVNMARHQRRNTLQKFSHCREKVKLLRNVALEIERINNKINLIFGNRDKYSITSNDSVAPNTDELEKALIQRHRRNVEEYEVVGFHYHAEVVLKKLDTLDSHREVVSIIGMGGLGKTTLAKKIYNGSFVRQSFGCRAWVDVSQDYNPRDLLLKIADSVFSPEEMKEIDGLRLTDERLVQKLADRLAQKRYLIVLDDVWDKQLWNRIKAALPENGKRSRVLITSRFKEVASHASTSSPPDPYVLPFLNDNDSWELFSRKLFRDPVCPPKHREIVGQILAKCKGLPLAIVVVAGLLRNRDPPMWSKVAADMDRYFAQIPEECCAILALSYEELPPHLKPCFLYFGVYPEDYEIQVRQLIRLWVAEGFLDQENNNNSDMEDMAEEYLLQLIDRSLIQVTSRRTDGGVKSCRIHDLLRDLSISEVKREMFLEVHKNIDAPLAANKPRRLSVLCGSRDIRYDYLSEVEFSRIRSLLCFGDKDKSIRSINRSNRRKLALDMDPFSRLSKFCRYMRVLDIGTGRSYNFPPKVERLVQLRYLRMSAVRRQQILPPISTLLNLQTLDAKDSKDIYFKANISKMQQLRHLLLPDLTNKTTFHIPKGKGSSALPNLRSLSPSVGGKNDLNILKMLPNLKKLKVRSWNEDLGLFEYFSKLERLQTLKIMGKFRLTDLVALPLSLTKITLSHTKLATSAFSQLGGIPNLQVLKLRSDSLIGSKIECGGNQGSFRRLEVLHIIGLDDLEWWSMEGEGLQSLVYLAIVSCSKLKGIPDQLKELSTLRQLYVRRCLDLRDSIYLMRFSDARIYYTD